MRVRAAAEIGEGDRDSLPALADLTKLQSDVALFSILFLKVPAAALLVPAVAGRAVRRDDLARHFIEPDGFPFRVFALAESVIEIRCPDKSVRHIASALFDQAHEHRHIGITARVIGEIWHLPLDMVFLEDDMAHGQRQRGIGALLRL